MIYGTVGIYIELDTDLRPWVNRYHIQGKNRRIAHIENAVNITIMEIIVFFHIGQFRGLPVSSG
jgi:hypothetical protein